MEAPSPLSLLFFKLTVVSIGVSCDDDLGAILGLVFFLTLVAGDTGVVGVASTDFTSEAGSGVSVAGTDSGVGSYVETGSGSGFFAGEALLLGGFFFSGSLRPSLHQFHGFRLDLIRILFFRCLG